VDSSEVVELAGRLIAARTPNPPGDERPAAQVVQAALAERGLPAARVLSKAPERPNLALTLDFGSGGRHLCLSGHLDTKPVGTANWRTDPFTATADGDRLYGLGSADMKGALAAMICAAARLAAAPPSAGRLTLLFTADEEDGAEWGARYLADSSLTESGLDSVDGVIIGEPGGLQADFDRLHLASRGIARLRLEVTGDQGHASLSDISGAVNASAEMSRLLAAFADRFQPSTPPPPEPLDGWRATVTGGLTLAGGVGYGVVPGWAAFAAEVRTLPGMTQVVLADELEKFLAEERAANPRLRAEAAFDTPPRDWLPATFVSSGSPLVATAQQACHKALGAVPGLAVFPGTTDAAFLQGLAGLPTLPALGPGLLARAHGADEWVSISAVNQAVSLYEAAARCFCSGPDGRSAR